MGRYASVPDEYAQHVLKGLCSVHALVPQCTNQFLTRLLRARISSWLVCSAHATVPDAYAQPSHQCQCTHQFLTLMLRVYKMNIWKIGKLMRMLSMHVRNWCVWSGWASVPVSFAQCAHKGWSMRVRSLIFSIIFKTTWNSENGLKSITQKFFLFSFLALILNFVLFQC